jgi:hypothetical protein
MKGKAVPLYPPAANNSSGPFDKYQVNQVVAPLSWPNFTCSTRELLLLHLYPGSSNRVAQHQRHVQHHKPNSSGQASSPPLTCQLTVTLIQPSKHRYGIEDHGKDFNLTRQLVSMSPKGRVDNGWGSAFWRGAQGL